MTECLRRFTAYLGFNPGLTAALLIAIVLSLIGANWGRVECWNLDQMAFRGVQHNGLPYGGYLKPPLDSYMNHLLVIKPIEGIRHQLTKDRSAQYPYQLLGVRLLTTVMFCGMLFLLYCTSSLLSDDKSATLITVLVATSAGLIKFNHFATADSPLLFWMMASFAMAVRTALSGKTLDALIAGILAGLAAADKYNGLGVAIAIPTCLMAIHGWKGFFGKLAWTGALGVILGFVLGNPGAVFDTQKFVQDFLYNLYTTPVYGGQTQGTGYADFLLAFPELIGWPASLLIAAAAAGTLLLGVMGKLTRNEILLMTGAGAVFGFYYLVMGRSPRIPDRFVLPVVPFVFLVAVPSLGRIAWNRAIPLTVALLLLAYNLACSLVLDLRFLSDPRMRAQIFAKTEFVDGVTVENSYAPNWDRLPGVHPHITTLPCATGRAKTFGKIFGDNKVIRKGIEDYETAGYPPDTFTAEGLSKRRPDYIAFSNQVFQFSGDDDAQRFYAALNREQFGYKKIFDEVWMPKPFWAYPSHVDFLVERMVILKRRSEG